MGRMLAPCGQMGPQVLGMGTRDPCDTLPSCFGTDHRVLLATLLPVSPSHGFQPRGAGKRFKFTLQNQPPRENCCWMDAVLCQALRSNLQRQKQHLSSVSQILLMQVTGPEKGEGC